MNSLRLNLLSDLKKNKLKQLVQFLFIKELLELAILTSALLGITHIVGWLVLSNFVNDLAQSTVAINRDYSGQTQEILHTNATIHTLQAASIDYIPLTPRLIDIATTLPPDIHLTSIQLDRVSKTLVLEGTAKTREALLRYQTTLLSLPWIGPLDIPPSQLFAKNNVDFQITAPLVNFPTLSTQKQAGQAATGNN